MAEPSHAGLQCPVRYLFRVVRNQAIDRLRRLILENHYHTEEEQLGEQAAASPSPERVILEQREWAALLGALDELPERALSDPRCPGSLPWPPETR